MPLGLDAAVASFKATRRDTYVDAALHEELQRRVANESFVVDVDMTVSDTSLIAAVDGSTRSGVMPIGLLVRLIVVQSAKNNGGRFLETGSGEIACVSSNPTR
ncbi:MAG: hypothetical protein QOK37_4726 [Thermoanaerobaculia bacterium]|nr:hypothetical protein [Thermoanaerobaculia bacterium]